jgi:Macrocin-O-methyltransferase (TylF).
MSEFRLGLTRLARAILGRKPPADPFYSVNPDVFIALVKAFNLQQIARVSGQDLLAGHGYYEFGLFRGASLWFAEQISREYTGKSFYFFGFDSFRGLPRPKLEIEAAVYRKGDFACSIGQVTENLKKYRADFARIRLYKGFFSPAHFARLAREQKKEFLPVSICLIDVDLYESTVPVLDFIAPYLVTGSLLLFDDFNQFGPDNQSGERRALLEFKARYPLFRAEHLFDYGREGVAFRVLSMPSELAQ